jgi:CheY-like chemotaxis protein/HPt (histidine-containing phosphotransfer) domain-containing protein
MLTSDRDREEAAYARQLDVRLFLVKPVKQASLIRSVSEIFGSVAKPEVAEASERQRLEARILIVEDNVTNQKVLLLRLEKLGCSVEVANNGSEALDAATAHCFDAILMDCEMPVMDGFEATRKIREQGNRVPIIALTANAMDGEREHCLKAGMDDYLSKPVRTKELVEKLTRWVQRQPEKTAAAERAAAPAAGTKDPRLSADLRAGLYQFIASMEEEGIESHEMAGVFESFLEGTAQLMADLGEAVGGRDSARVTSAAHTLKGSSANLGFKPLADLASKLERAGEQQKWEEAGATLALAALAHALACDLVKDAIHTPAA